LTKWTIGKMDKINKTKCPTYGQMKE